VGFVVTFTRERLNRLANLANLVYNEVVHLLFVELSMKTVSSTEIKNRLGQYLEKAIAEPVVIEKAGRKVAVVLSFDEYNRLLRLEDSYWAARARAAEESGWIGQEESMKLIKEVKGAET